MPSRIVIGDLACTGIFRKPHATVNSLLEYLNSAEPLVATGICPYILGRHSFFTAPETPITLLASQAMY